MMLAEKHARIKVQGGAMPTRCGMMLAERHAGHKL